MGCGQGRILQDIEMKIADIALESDVTGVQETGDLAITNFGGEECFGTEQDYDASMFFSDNDERLNQQERFRTFDGISAIQTTYYIVV